MTISKRIDDIVTDVRCIRDDMSEVIKTLAVHTEILSQSTKRTDELEEQVENLATPLKWIKTTLAAAGTLSAAGPFGYLVYKTIGYFNKMP